MLHCYQSHLIHHLFPNTTSLLSVNYIRVTQEKEHLHRFGRTFSRSDYGFYKKMFYDNLFVLKQY